MGQECLPGHTLRVGDPLLVRIRVAAGRILGFHDRALCACQPVIDLVKLRFVLGLDTEVREAVWPLNVLIAKFTRGSSSIYFA